MNTECNNQKIKKPIKPDQILKPKKPYNMTAQERKFDNYLWYAIIILLVFYTLIKL